MGAAIVDLRPPGLATVSPGTQKLLGPPNRSLVKFTKGWQETHVAGKLFRIKVANQVPHVIHKICPVSDSVLIDLSNETATSENLYPTAVKWLYELNIGFRPGNYLTYVQVPAGQYLDRLHQSMMTPTTTNVILRYLGGLKPEDSPSADKRMFIYTVQDLEPIILQCFVDTGILHEKIILDVLVNKCELEEIVYPTPDQSAKAFEIAYYTEQKGSATT